MRIHATRAAVAAAASAVVALTATAAAPSGTGQRAPASARAFAVRVLVPGSPVAGTEEVAAPPEAVSAGGTYSYPDDGSVVSAASATASAATARARAGAVRSRALAEVQSLSLFGGEVTVERVAALARASASAKTAGGSTDGSAVSGLAVLGQPATGSQVALGDWGTAAVSTIGEYPVRVRGANAFRSAVTALSIELTTAHGGLPGGTRILVGSVEAVARAPRPVPARHERPRPAPPPPSRTPRRAQAPEPKPAPFGLPRIRTVPKGVTARLTPSGYVFPVFGPSSWSDTFGAPRADTGWHHGEDIFAPLGAPVLAVNDGFVFSVGFIPIGGNRLWVRDEQGNEFYYAHLSAYSPLAVDGRRVRAGDVLGFVGDTGDARGTPYHLHFEIHPVGLLRLGYDGVVNPTRFLSAWQHLQDLPFTAARRRGGAAAWARGSAGSSAPAPGAILLGASDISQSSGLDHGSIEHALADPARSEADGSFLRRG